MPLLIGTTSADLGITSALPQADPLSFFGATADRLATDWAAIRSYQLSNGHLFLALMADGGIYEFEPLSSSP